MAVQDLRRKNIYARCLCFRVVEDGSATGAGASSEEPAHTDRTGCDGRSGRKPVRLNQGEEIYEFHPFSQRLGCGYADSFHVPFPRPGADAIFRQSKAKLTGKTLAQRAVRDTWPALDSAG